MQHLDMDRVTAQLRARVGEKPAVTITEHSIIEDGLARVICQFTPGNRGAESNLQALQEKLEGKVSPIKNSFRVLSKEAGRLTVVGFLTANREVRELTEEVRAKMTTYSKNILMDAADESLWDIQRTPSGQVFISRQGNEDLSELMASASEPRFGIPTFASIASAVSVEDEYAAFASVQGDIRFGFITEASSEGFKVLCRDNQEVVEIKADQVVMTVSHVDAGEILEKARKQETAADKGTMIDYYKKLYSYDPEYLADVERQINEHAAL